MTSVRHSPSFPCSRCPTSRSCDLSEGAGRCGRCRSTWLSKLKPCTWEVAHLRLVLAHRARLGLVVVDLDGAVEAGRVCHFASQRSSPGRGLPWLRPWPPACPPSSRRWPLARPPAWPQPWPPAWRPAWPPCRSRRPLETRRHGTTASVTMPAPLRPAAPLLLLTRPTPPRSVLRVGLTTALGLSAPDGKGGPKNGRGSMLPVALDTFWRDAERPCARPISPPKHASSGAHTP